MAPDTLQLLAILATLLVVAGLLYLATRRPRPSPVARAMPVAAPSTPAAGGAAAGTAPATDAPAFDVDRAERVIVQYIEAVDRHVGQLVVDESVLAAPKAEIRRCLQVLIHTAADETARARLSGYYLRLAAFQPGPIALPDMTDAPVDWTSLPVKELRELLITVRNDAVSDGLIRVELEEARLAKDLQALSRLAPQLSALQ